MTDYMLNSKFNDPFNKVQFGVSIGERNQLEEFAKVLRSGARMVEIDVASVYGLGGEQGNAADTISKTEREAIANLAKTNDVDLSVHAPWAINFSGIEPQSKAKSELYEHLVEREIGTALEFADDISKKLGRKNMPVIFHASSDNLSDPDKSLVYSVYDQRENKVIPVTRQEIDLGIDKNTVSSTEERKRLAMQKFRDLYGESFYQKVFENTGNKNLGFVSDDGKVILSPEGAVELQKKSLSQQMNQERASLNISLRNLEYQKMELGVKMESLRAKLNNPNITTDELKKYQSESQKVEKEIGNIDEMVKNLNQKYAELEIDEKTLPNRFVSYDKKAPELAAEGIVKAAMFSYNNTESKPMILVENPMSPDMSLSDPRDTAEAVRIAREEFAKELHEKQKLSLKEAEKISSDLIGINLDIGHINVFKSYINPNTGKPYSDKDIVEMAKAAGDYLKRYHLNDNMGNKDSHLPLGQGNAPIKEVYDAMMEKGLDVPAIMEVFGGLGGLESGTIQSLQYMGAPLYGNIPYVSLPSYLGQPYSSIVGDYSSYSNLGLKQDMLPYGGFSGIFPAVGGGYMENKGNSSFSGAPMA
ncbi:MAG: TIM barrel protein [Candidatus Parvarchaeota archaeon]|nr:TIM barrel protein [Candidatus Parvarchaeum tengchongense]MCW1295150.1 TIM barrel protein [Candidatus Parvarchaeum tengchongense]MCW1299019.1 TIM barrel protein [Candidatus Parvarchaeum tengchongense]MCW1312113.1 TIM barrel protein [Candidatus Parvarchaeum tengchongense]